jgi:hypothetical protein
VPGVPGSRAACVPRCVPRFQGPSCQEGAAPPTISAIRVGVYIDGFNLYYGGRAHCGQSTAGWRWLDVRALAEDLLGRRKAWTAEGAQITRVLYCTASIDAVTNPVGQREQDAYLKALVAGGSVDHIQYGHYVSRVKSAPLATRFDGRSVTVYSVLSHPTDGRPGIVYGREALALVKEREFEAGTAGRTPLPKEGDAVSMQEQEPQSPGGPQEPTPGEPGTMPQEPETAPEAPDMPEDPDRDPSQSPPDEPGSQV